MNVLAFSGVRLACVFVSSFCVAKQLTISQNLGQSLGITDEAKTSLLITDTLLVNSVEAFSILPLPLHANHAATEVLTMR